MLLTADALSFLSTLLSRFNSVACILGWCGQNARYGVRSTCLTLSCSAQFTFGTAVKTLPVFPRSSGGDIDDDGLTPTAINRDLLLVPIALSRYFFLLLLNGLANLHLGLRFNDFANGVDVCTFGRTDVAVKYGRLSVLRMRILNQLIVARPSFGTCILRGDDFELLIEVIIAVHQFRAYSSSGFQQSFVADRHLLNPSCLFRLTEGLIVAVLACGVTVHRWLFVAAVTHLFLPMIEKFGLSRVPRVGVVSRHLRSLGFLLYNKVRQVTKP